MQLSEFRDLLANDGFAATFQTMGQYRTELLRALDGLRAQADARPVAHEVWGVRIGDSDMWAYTQTESDADFIGKQSGLPYEKRRYTHPEASAPGLSDEAIESIARECEPTVTGMHPEAVVEIVRACLTRASAATVAEPSKDEPCSICGKGTGKAICDGGLLGHYCDTCGSVYGNADDMRLNKARAIEAEQLGYVLGELPEAARQQAEPREADYCTESNCRRCNTPKALRKPDMYHAGIGSQPQAAQQAEPVGDERAALRALIAGSQYGLQFGDGGLRKGRSLTAKETAVLLDALRSQSGQRAGVAEKCAKFAELYRDEHACGREAEEACTEIARACREFAAAPTQQKERRDGGAA